MKPLFIGLSSFFLLSNAGIYGQSTTGNARRIPNSEVFSLTLAPDARSAAMGEAGVASSADANSTYWNASKLPFAKNDFGASASYTPWLRTLVNDRWLGYATAYKKLKKGQALAASIQYFSDGNYALGIPPNQNGYIHANQYSISGTYSRQLGRNFSAGLTLKYISAYLNENAVISSNILSPARTAAADLSVYYRKQTKNEVTGSDITWSLGAVISNFGGKVSYTSQPDTEFFIPTALKIGGGLSFTANGRHRFNFVMDAAKLMIPTPIEGQNVNAKPLLKGIIGSFSDAPDGFKEELQEISLGAGAEYWYKDAFALRGGYHGENRNKGDRRYFTMGAGVRFLKNYGADFSYLIPVDKGNPLAQTFRITASVYLNDKKNRML